MNKIPNFIKEDREFEVGNMKYELAVGLEVHAELSTDSKIFCNCTTKFGGDVNTHCCPVCTGMPGTLPVLNRNVVEYAIRAGLAMNCEIAGFTKQDRKNYFYPDLPKAYQISQYDLPLCKNGYIEIDLGNTIKKINITRIHIEEDAGKLIHDEREKGSLVDYNRCGVPLIEIVSEPDMSSTEEIRIFLESIKSILQYIDISDCKMQEGSLRADVNVSVRPADQKKFGTRTEMKNLNSFKAILRAVEEEAKRQEKVLNSGETIVQETRRWDDIKGLSFAMRNKEEAHDYRYFPEPDLPPVVIDKDRIQEIKLSLPELSGQRKKRYISEFGIPEYDAGILTSSKALADFFEETVKMCSNAKAVSNWIMGDAMKILKDREMDAHDIPFPPGHFAEMINLIEKGKISGNIGKKVLLKMFDSGKSPAAIVKEEELEVVSDKEALLDLIKEVITSSSKTVDDYRNGKKKAIGFLIGQCMKKTKGRADPKIVNKILREELDQ